MFKTVCFDILKAYLVMRVNNFPTFYLRYRGAREGGSNFSINEKWDHKHEITC